MASTKNLWSAARKRRFGLWWETVALEGELEPSHPKAALTHRTPNSWISPTVFRYDQCVDGVSTLARRRDDHGIQLDLVDPILRSYQP